MKDVTEMTDAELSAIVTKLDIAEAAREEQERRRIERESVAGAVPHCSPRTIVTTDAPCPECGRNDSVHKSKTMYATPDLAQGGEPIGTMACCSCGTVYNAATGKGVDLSKVYTY